jgi:SET domain-containing protein
MLYLRPSHIPNAGLGLYTDSPIAKGEDVIEYTGEILTWKECEKRDGEGKGGYFFYISSRHCIDARPDVCAMGRYANDAMGLVRVPGLRNNCDYINRKRRIYIVARRNIKAGEEIFVSYGKDYWKYFGK